MATDLWWSTWLAGLVCWFFADFSCYKTEKRRVLNFQLVVHVTYIAECGKSEEKGQNMWMDEDTMSLLYSIVVVIRWLGKIAGKEDLTINNFTPKCLITWLKATRWKKARLMLFNSPQFFFLLLFDGIFHNVKKKSWKNRAILILANWHYRFVVESPRWKNILKYI